LGGNRTGDRLALNLLESSVGLRIKVRHAFPLLCAEAAAWNAARRSARGAGFYVARMLHGAAVREQEALKPWTKWELLQHDCNKKGPSYFAPCADAPQQSVRSGCTTSTPRSSKSRLKSHAVWSASPVAIGIDVLRRSSA
jgi:hypothetical protein